MNAWERSLGISGNFQVQEVLNKELSPEARAEFFLKTEGQKKLILYELNYHTCITEHVGRGPAQLNLISW